MAYKAVFDQERTFGVEIEVLGSNREKAKRELREVGITVSKGWEEEANTRWRIIGDASIEGRGSLELVSPILAGKEGFSEVGRAMEALSLAGFRVNKSCGFHVHWNCGDYTGKNVLSLLRLYTKFEDVINYLVAPSRRNNEYCYSMLKDWSWKMDWVSALDPSEKARAIEVVSAFERRHAVPSPRDDGGFSGRYHKVNPSAYMLYGTIEFRQHQGTLNAEKAGNWMLFTQQLVNKAKMVAVSKEHSYNPTIGEMLRVLRLTPKQLKEDGCDDPMVWFLAPWLKERYWQFRNGLEE